MFVPASPMAFEWLNNDYTVLQGKAVEFERAGYKKNSQMYLFLSSERKAP